MALIKAGVWHTTVWVSRTWQEDLWLEYGTGVVAGGSSEPYYYVYGIRKRKSKKELLTQISQLLYAIKGDKS